MSEDGAEKREGSLDAPTRHPVNWRDPDFYDADSLHAELERVFDICHGCRRCFSLCNSFPTLFDAVDDSPTMEVDSVPKEVFWDVVDHCYLCDMCYMSKCPYVPPHEWNVDFPHLMLRAKAKRFRDQGASKRDRILSSTLQVGKLAGIPVVAQAVNAVNRSKTGRKLLEKTLGVHRNAPLPEYHSRTLAKRLGDLPVDTPAETTATTTGKVALFATCYGNRNQPDIGEDLVKIFRHNALAVTLTGTDACCGMPKLELGDLDSVARYKEANIPGLAKLVDDDWDIVAPIPSCVLMFKQELPLLFPGDAAVAKVAAAFFDPFEYLMLRHKAGKLRTDFKTPLGSISYHVACHLRVQNIGLKTRDLLALIPDTSVEPIERCSGHNGTYAVKREYHETSMKIGRPVMNRVARAASDHYSSDCPMAGHQIAGGLDADKPPEHPLTLLRMAYGL